MGIGETGIIKPLADVFWFIEQGWKAIWMQRTNWLFSALPVLAQVLSAFQGEPERSLLWLLIGLTEGFLGFLSFIGVPYLAYRFLIGRPATITETLSAIWKFAGRVIGCSCLVFLIISPCIFLTLAMSMDRTTEPPQFSDRAFIIFQLFSLFSAVTNFSMFGFFANNSGIRQTLRDAWTLFTAHFRVLAALGLIMTIMFSMSNTAAGMIAVLFQSGFELTSLSGINYINPSASLYDNKLFVFLSGIGQTIYAPFSASVFALAYLKYGGIETPSMRQN